MSKIKTADQILQKALDKAYTVQELEKGIIEPNFIQEAMKEYAEQFIDYILNSNDFNEILKIKELIK